MATRFAICFLMLSHCSFSQTIPLSPNRLDENGKRTGHWTILFDSTFQKELKNPDSAVYYRLLRYEAGKPVGKVRDFYRTGQKQWDGYVISFNPDIVDGEANQYFENGQVRYKANYQNGKLNGPFQQFNTHGVLLVDGLMKNDSASGHWIYYNDDGIKYSEKTFKAGNETGPAVEYHLNGNVKRKGLRVNNMDEGYWESFYENGNPHTKCYYQKDKRHGPFEWYNEQGKLEQKGQYTNGSETGAWVSFHPDGITLLGKGEVDSLGKQKHWEYFFVNGKKKTDDFYVDNLKEGKITYYHQSGGVESEGMCHRNLNEGEWKFYFEDGALRQKVIYLHDTIHGLSLEYYPNGQLKSEGTKVHGEKDGIWKFYFENGKLDAVEETKKGVLHGRLINYYVDGKAKDSSRYVNGLREGLFISFHPNGMKDAEGAFQKDKRHGVWKWYYPNGQLWSKYFYINGVYEGPYENYHANGNKKEFGEEKNGKRNGQITYWFANGNLDQTGKYENGLAQGHWVHYDSITKKKIKDDNYNKGKPDGKAIFYDSNGKREDVSYYINGFWEETFSIRDSVNRLIDAKRYDDAIKGVAWIERVLKRDHFLNKPAAAVPSRLYSTIALNKGDYDAALKWSKIYLDLTKKFEGDTSHNYSVALGDIGNVYDASGNYAEAMRIYRLTLTYDSLKKDFHNYMIDLGNLANTLKRAGKESTAVTLLQNNIIAQEKAKGRLHADTWESKSYSGSFYYNTLTDYQKTIEVYQPLYSDIVESKNEDAKSRELQERCHNFISDSYQSLRQTREAISWYKTAISFTEKNGIRNLERYLHNGLRLGYDYFLTGQTDSAMLTYDKMITIINANNYQNTEAYAEALNGKGELYYNESLNDQALQLWEAGASLCQKIKKTKTITYANILSGLSQMYRLKGDFAKAEKVNVEGVEIKKEISGEGSSQYLSMLNGLGDFYRETEQYDKAMNTLKESEKQILQYKGKQSKEYAECMNMIGEVYYGQDKYKAAIEYNERSFDYFKLNVANSPTNYADVLSNQSKYYRSLEDFVTAEKLMIEALRVLSQYMGEDNTDYLSYTSSLAYLYSKQGLYSDALKIYSANLVGYKKLVAESNPQYMRAVRSIGRCYLDQSEYAKAEPYYRQYRDLILKYLGEKNEDYFDAIYRLAVIYFNLERDNEAEPLYRKVISLSKSFYGTAHPEYAFYLKEFAHFQIEHNMQLAESYLTEAVGVLAKSYSQSVNYADYLVELADVKATRNKNQEAETLFLQAKELLEKDKENNLWSYADAGKSLAGFYEQLGRYNESEKLLKEVTDLIEKRQGKKYSYATYRLPLVGLYYSWDKNELARGEASALITYMEEELAPSHYLFVELYNILGLVALNERKFDEAQTHFQHCIDVRKQSKADLAETDASLQNNMALVQIAKGNFSGAEKSLNEAFVIYKKLNSKLDPRTEATMVDNYASLYQSWGKLDRAEKYWLEVTSKLLRYSNDNFYFMSDEEKSQFWNGIKSDFEWFNTFAILRAKQNPLIIGEMYNNQLATKAILLSASNKIKNRILRSGDKSMISQYYNWVEMKEKLAQLITLPEVELKSKKAQLDSLQASATRAEKDLNISSDDLENERGKSKIKWREVQRVLSADEAAIEIIRFRYFDRYSRDSVLYAALVLTAETKQNPMWVVLPNGKFLENKALRYYKNAIIARIEDRLSFKQFWSPIDALIKDKKRIYLSLDGVYNQINLNTLLDDQGKFLVESKNFTTVSNTKDLLALKSKKAKRNQTNTASLFGYPKYFIGKDHLKEKLKNSNRSLEVNEMSDENKTGIAELPGTLTEIEGVKNILTASHWQPTEYIDESATEKAIKSIGFPALLHVATHGYFDDEAGNATDFKVTAEGGFVRQNPMLRSGILLSGASNFIQNHIRLDDENGILTAYEAANLNLDNTELVVLSACETGKGEIKNGEGVYGLQRAFQTAGAQAIIMSLWKVDDEATQQLMTSFYQSWMKGLSKAEAFRTAQLSLKAKYSHPYFWGAFVMMGE